MDATKEALMHEVIRYYGGIQRLAEYCGVSRQAIYNCRDRGAFTPRIAIFIERDTLGLFRAIELAD